MFEEIIKSSRTSLSERLASPLMGSFVISWCIWNYKFLVILFSLASVTKTFELIDSVAFPDTSTLLLRGAIFPALTAAIYIFLYPYPAKFVFEFTRNRQKEINDIRRRIEDETPLTLEESRKIRSELHRREKEHVEEIDRKDEEIGRLKAEIASLRSPPTLTPVKKKPITASTISVTENSQLGVLKLIEKAGGKMWQKSILDQNKNSKMKTEYDLGELERLKLLKKNFDPMHSDYSFEFTHEGRGYLLALPKSGGIRRAAVKSAQAIK